MFRVKGFGCLGLRVYVGLYWDNGKEDGSYDLDLKV